jgi:hypothetical protein
VPKVFSENKDIDELMSFALSSERILDYKHPVDSKVLFLPKFCSIRE